MRTTTDGTKRTRTARVLAAIRENHSARPPGSLLESAMQDALGDEDAHIDGPADNS
jgi:hypothetical protein